jgi:subtilisin-like proprotein convertase family protein
MIVLTYEVKASARVANGTWRLRVNDNVVASGGSIDAFGLQF